jgi:hypothetical protein
MRYSEDISLRYFRKLLEEGPLKSNDLTSEVREALWAFFQTLSINDKNLLESVEPTLAFLRASNLFKTLEINDDQLEAVKALIGDSFFINIPLESDANVYNLTKLEITEAIFAGRRFLPQKYNDDAQINQFSELLFEKINEMKEKWGREKVRDADSTYYWITEEDNSVIYISFLPLTKNNLKYNLNYILSILMLIINFLF